jgi:maltooligosyltrehalose trehalohydrolase
MPSSELPPVAFVDFLQNHDQIGNRAFGDRLTTLAPPEAVDALTAVLLLSPHIPLLYMGEEWGETRPFLFFTDFHGELGDAVREGRRNEFSRWRSFQDPAYREKIPDPNAEQTFQASKLNWAALGSPGHEQRLALVKRLLTLRKAELMPRLAQMGGDCATRQIVEGAAVHLAWAYGTGEYTMTANLSPEPLNLPGTIADALNAASRPIFELPAGAAQALKSGRLEAWSAIFSISDASNT